MQSLVMSIIILVYSAFNALFIKRLSAKLHYAVWIVLLAGLLIPINHLTGSGLINIPISTDTIHVAPMAFPGGPFVQANNLQDITTAIPVKELSLRWPVSPLMVCILIWGIVAAIVFAYQIKRYSWFANTISRWSEPVKDEFSLSIFRDVKEKLGLGNKKIEFRICEFTNSSLLTGFLQPVVVLPKKQFEADELELILHHELIHYKRRDLYVKFLSALAVSIHWFNPIVHWMTALMQADMEASCDEIVLQGEGDENRRFYAELMIKMMSGRRSEGSILSTCFYGGKRSVKKRLITILNSPSKVKRSTIFITVIFFAAITLFSGSVFAFTAQSPRKHIEDDEYISLEQVKETAIAAVGGGMIGRTERKYNKDGKFEHYTVSIIFGENKYDVAVDIHDGTVRNLKMEQVTTIDKNVYDMSGIIAANAAKSIAIERAGGGVATMCKLEYRPLDSALAYHVHVANDGVWEHCVEINAITGNVNFYEPRHRP